MLSGASIGVLQTWVNIAINTKVEAALLRAALFHRAIPLARRSDMRNGMANDDGLDIPESLLVKNRKPLTKAQQALVDAAMSPVNKDAEKAAWAQSQRLPKNTEPAALAMLEAEKKAKSISAVKPAKAAKAAKASVRAARAGMVTVASIAQEYGLIPRVARACLRTAKIAKPAVGWAYDAKDPALVQVRDVLRAGVVVKGDKKPAKPEPAKVEAAKIPPPSETVWSGKAKKNVQPTPVASSAKAKAREEIAKAVKASKKKAK